MVWETRTACMAHNLKSLFPVWEYIEYRRVAHGIELWYGDTQSPIFIRVLEIPGHHTLASDILHFKKDLPVYGRHLEITGDNICFDITPIDIPPDELDFPDPDLEDCSTELASLPVVVVDPDIHFTKAPTYRREIHNLIRCQGSPCIVQLKGRSEDGLLVFERLGGLFAHRSSIPADMMIPKLKDRLIEMAQAVSYLHSMGIVHRDLVLPNWLYNGRAVLCDLQCLNASMTCAAPEVVADKRFSTASDIYGFGICIWSMVYNNNPFTPFSPFGFPPPPPFESVFLACTRPFPEDRTSIDEVLDMLRAI